MTPELFRPGLSLSSYSSRISLEEKYIPEPGGISSEDEKREIVDSLLKILVREERLYDGDNIPEDYMKKRNLLRALLNIRPPSQINKSFLEKIDRLLQHELLTKTIIKYKEIPSVSNEYNASNLIQGHRISLWKGDITCLKADAIVNAANDRMLGCFHPLHNCIDNIIHSAAGPLLREDCSTIMDIQKSREQTGDAKITRGYNLPSRYVLHTVGPVIEGKDVSEYQQQQLASCYKSCLSLAAQIKDIKTVAFPCISTGVFNFPRALASEIAVNAVDEWLDSNDHNFSHIIFDVFLEEDFFCYARILRG